MPLAQQDSKKGVPLPDSVLQKHVTSQPATPLWGEADGLDSIKIPASRPDALVYLRTENSYIKVFELSREGEPLFGNGALAREFTGTVTAALAEKVGNLCKPSSDAAAIGMSVKQAKAFQEMSRAFDTQTRAANIAMSTMLVLAALFVLTFAINRARGT
ncbi:MAG: hypothetical protein MUP21_05265 [Dehalococcoidia bacterium]|nr:hypothetical protein [Dehalococcoidia bacterium]